MLLGELQGLLNCMPIAPGSASKVFSIRFLSEDAGCHGRILDTGKSPKIVPVVMIGWPQMLGRNASRQEAEVRAVLTPGLPALALNPFSSARYCWVRFQQEFLVRCELEVLEHYPDCQTISVPFSLL